MQGSKPWRHANARVSQSFSLWYDIHSPSRVEPVCKGPGPANPAPGR